MIIKRHNAPKPEANLSPEEENLVVDDQAKSTELSEPNVEWSIEAFEQGLVPERRGDGGADRRRRGQFRRLEDKNLISQAHEEANAIREKAQKEGFDEGLEQAQGVIDELRETIEKLMSAREEVMLTAVDQIAPIAIEIAQRIIKTEVSCDEALVMGLVEDAIRKAGRDQKSILIKVFPDDVPIVKQSLQDNPLPNIQAELVVMDDPTVDKGSCIVETNSGLVDASFSTQLNTLRRLFGGSEEEDS